jgi:hypothetical protein
MPQAKKENEPIKLVGAGKMMEDLFLANIFPFFKATSERVEIIQKTIENNMGDERRREYGQVVAKYVPNNVYETDVEGLSHYLSDYGIFIPCAKIDVAQIKKLDDAESILNMLEPFKNSLTYYTRINLNKEGKAKVSRVELNSIDLSIGNVELANKWTRAKHQQKIWEDEVENARLQMLHCPILQKEGNLKCNFGSVSYLPNQPTYNIRAIFDEYGTDFLMKYAKINMAQLEFFIHRGMVSRKEIKPFRRIVDIILKFVVIDKETESKLLSMVQAKMICASQNRRIV